MISLILAGLAALLSIAYASLIMLSPRPPTHTPSERTYRTPSSSTPLPLPLLSSPATLELSVVVPAYNERARLGIMLRDAVDYLEERVVEGGEEVEGVERGSYEVLVVDDGSKDGTTEVALELAEELEKKWSKAGRVQRGSIKVVTLVRNRGKGGSVKHGILHSAGSRILFVDADGATHFPDLALLESSLSSLSLSQSSNPHGVIVGSRAHLVRTEQVVKRSFLRNLLMRLFHTYLYLLGIRTIRDTQCGFKLHTRSTAALLYPLLHSPSWIFDCELLLLASLAGIPAREVGVQWHEVEGSKVDLVRDSIGMAVDLLVIRGNYAVGRWEKPAWVGVEGREKVE